MTGTEKDLENLASAVRNSKQPTTMTFNEIEKEFDEELPKMISDLVWCVSDGGYKIESHRFLSYQDEPVQEYENIKSFLKQSFIKYLQEQQRLVKNLAVGVSIDQRGRAWIDIEDLIKLYQAQIKELEV